MKDRILSILAEKKAFVNKKREEKSSDRRLFYDALLDSLTETMPAEVDSSFIAKTIAARADISIASWYKSADRAEIVESFADLIMDSIGLITEDLDLELSDKEHCVILLEAFPERRINIKVEY